VAKDYWTIHGSICVKETLTTNVTKYRDLEGVTIKVYGATVKGAWNFWDRTITDEEGRFSIVTLRSNKPHFIKITATFSDDDFYVNYHTVAITHSEFTIFKTDSKRQNFDVDAGDMVFGVGSELELGKIHGYRTATVWYIIKTAMTTLANKDPRFALKKQFYLVLHHYNGALGWTHGRKIDLGYDSFDVITILHEFSHMWNFDHNKGTTNWPVAACAGLDTHNFREFKNVAFHEGFAHYSAFELRHHIWKQDKPKPFSRHKLHTHTRNTHPAPILMTSTLEHNDDGVYHGLNLVTAINPGKLILGGGFPVSPDGPATVEYDESADCPNCHHLMDYWDILTVFLPNESMGVTDFWNVTKNNNGLIKFLERATKLIPAYTQEAHAAILELLDPSSNVEGPDVCAQFCSCKDMLVPNLVIK
jgi:hypothetical protein